MTTEAHATSGPPISDWAIPPGEYLAEVLGELGLSQAELARRMGRPAQAINELLKGEKELTPETALQLEQVLDVPAHLWTGLEAEYQLVKAREVAAQGLAQERELLPHFPLKKLADLGFIRRLRDKAEQVRELRRFFGVATLAAIPEVRAYQPAFRRQIGGKDHSYAVAAWLRAGTISASKIQTDEFHAARLRSCVAGVRHLTCEDPSTSFPRLQSDMAGCGVALVVLPHFDGTGIHGAVFWERPAGVERAVVLVTLRRRYSDTFWFSLLHELGHVVLHKPDRRSVFLDDDSVDDVREQEANDFAADALLDSAAYGRFADTGDYSAEAVQAFAAQERVCAGVVVGRLQIEKRLGYNALNGLRVQYTLTTHGAE